MGATIDRVKLITEVLKDHQQQHGIRDLDVHCLCGWSAPSHTGRHKEHQARHIEAALFGTDSAKGEDWIGCSATKPIAPGHQFVCGLAPHDAGEHWDPISGVRWTAAGSVGAGEDGTVTP